MNVYPDVTIDIMLKVQPYLKEKGNIVLTLKFIDPRVEKSINEVNSALSEKYKILKIKNLFHNRKEVTYLLEKK
jgi:23S rRNA (cytidine2498-2'-O)-methyltransferase